MTVDSSPTLGPLVPGVRHIAVLRANALGDFAVALPALDALRHAYPQAEISLLAREWHAAFLRGRPSPIDNVIVLPPAIGLNGHSTGPKAVGDSFVAGLRERGFDMALQLHGGGQHSNPFVRSLGARLSAGLCAADATPLDRNLRYREPQAEALRLVEAVSLVGARLRTLDLRWKPTDADRQEAAAVLPDDGAPLLVLQPGCRDPRRAWPAERFAAVGDHFAARGARVLLNGTVDEAETLARVQAAMRHPAQPLGGALSIGGLMAVLARATLLVSNDTGTAHLARLVGLPTVTVFWIGNVAGYAPLFTARDAVAVSWRLHCPVCGEQNVSQRCPHDPSFVDLVTVDEVLALATGFWPAAGAGFG